MAKLIYITLLLILTSASAAYPNDSISIQNKAAQMLIVGFRGTILQQSNPIYADIATLKIGGVILFDYDTPTKTRPRNIKSAQQVHKLINSLQALGNHNLFISIDQEGGYVNRLKTRNGFPLTRTAQYLGKLNHTDSTAYWAMQTAQTLHQLGFNLNFAPSVDVNSNPTSPAIGKVQRSFSANPTTVSKHAEIWIDAQTQQNIISCIKHFPGHGSATADTHKGMVDVTATWSEQELVPYNTLIKLSKADMIMTSHIIHQKLDSVPATLSYNIITKLLRQQMDYNGIVVSDDIAMGAIAHYYPLEQAIEMAINAGVDLLILSNNGDTFDPQVASKAVTIICKLVKEGKISKNRIDESYQRIMALKQKYKLHD